VGNGARAGVRASGEDASKRNILPHVPLPLPRGGFDTILRNLFRMSKYATTMFSLIVLDITLIITVSSMLIDCADYNNKLLIKQYNLPKKTNGGSKKYKKPTVGHFK